MAQFDRVDGFADQRPPDAGGDRNRNDDRHDDRVIARHLEDHDDRGHHPAGSRADHGRHADDRRRWNGQTGMGKNQARDGGEGAAERRPEIERG